MSQYEQARFIGRMDRRMVVQRARIESFLSQAKAILSGGGPA
jgi:hypothetical protein